MRLTTSSTAILSAVKEFSKATRKQNGKAYNDFIAFDVCEETETMDITAADGDVRMEKTLCLLEVEGSCKFKVHIKRLMYILGLMPEMPIGIFTQGSQVCFNVTLGMGMLVNEHKSNEIL